MHTRVVYTRITRTTPNFREGILHLGAVFISGVPRTKLRINLRFQASRSRRCSQGILNASITRISLALGTGDVRKIVNTLALLPAP